MKKYKLSRINIFDINVVYEMLQDVSVKQERSNLSIIIRKMKNIFKIPTYNKRKLDNKNIKSHVLFFGESDNNQRSFKSIQDNLISSFCSIKNDNDFPISKYIYLSLPCFVYFIKSFLKANALQKKLIIRFPLQYFFAYGKYKIAYEILKTYSPKILILANDHSPLNRCLLHLANLNNIRTLYVQHASVTNRFPKLLFDYAFLDGLESFEKYQMTSKEKSKVLLIGPSRYDSFYKQKIKSIKKTIGVSINQFDDIDIVKNLCIELRKEFIDYNLIVRPHPNMTSWYKKWFESNGIIYSDSQKEPPDHYLSLLDIQISNACGIHLDALLLGVNTVLYKLSTQEIEDHYGYLENNLVKKVDCLDSLFIYIKDNIGTPLEENIKAKLNYYVSSVGSNYEGRVGQVIAEYIEAIMFNKNKESKIEDKYKIKVYRY